jgi:hypothetical protein
VLAQYDGEQPEHVDVAANTLPLSEPAINEAFMHVPPSTGRLAMVINAGATETVALRTRRRAWEDVGFKARKKKGSARTVSNSRATHRASRQSATPTRTCRQSAPDFAGAVCWLSQQL